MKNTFTTECTGLGPGDENIIHSGYTSCFQNQRMVAILTQTLKYLHQTL